MNNKILTYSELITFESFEDRFNYLTRLDQTIGEDTFGFDRYLNQIFYKTKEWKDLRDYIFVRDNGCDLGVEGFEIYGTFIIHHLNPITKDDILSRSEYLTNPEYLITTVKKTHNAIHYSDLSLLTVAPIERTKNDTCPWRH